MLNLSNDLSFRWQVKSLIFTIPPQAARYHRRFSPEASSR